MKDNLEEKATDKKAGEDRHKKTKVKEIEIVVIVPATPGSILIGRLQKQDNLVCQASNCLQVRFVERAGTTVMEELGRNNPWANEWSCPRQDCLPCQGHLLLAAEAEEEAMKMAGNTDTITTKTKKEERISLPSCTGEGANYCIECLTCRQEGRRRLYLGETSRSPYQRGAEHEKEVREGVPSHPLVIHCMEEHGG